MGGIEHKILINVKEQHKQLDRAIEQIIADLNVAKQKKIALEGLRLLQEDNKSMSLVGSLMNRKYYHKNICASYDMSIDDIDTCTIQTLKMEKAINMEQAALLRSQKEGDMIKKQIKNEKQLQIQHIKLYENKMASIADKLRNGPKFYDRKVITAEISSLHKETRAIDRELASVEEELNELRMKYGSVFKESLDNPGITEGDAFELSTLKHVISQLAEDNELHNSEEQQFCEELKNLQELSSALQKDLQELK